MSTSQCEVIEVPGGVPVKAWTRGVPFEEEAREQLRNAARLPFVHRWVVAMPDVHWGIGATVGSVIPTVGAVVPAAVGVDIGCGMMAVQTSLAARDLPESLAGLRSAIERAVPHGRSGGRRGRGRDVGAWGNVPDDVMREWGRLAPGFERIADRHPALRAANHVTHLGTLGTGNHFIEVCLDEADRVWFLLHSGSRGVGNRIGRYFIALAREEMLQSDVQLPDADLAYLPEGSEHFADYVEAVEWAQGYAIANRERMMRAVIAAARGCPGIPPFTAGAVAVNCHHNYVAREHHYGADVLVTRKGALRARRGDLGIIPGSMGAHTYIVRGKGNPESFESCSHGAGRAMSRNAARRVFTVADHAADTAGVECRKDEAVLDETPRAYKPIDAVMAAQSDLVEVVHTLRQVVCVKG
jgi:tRNA-splicing ligase RtcB